MNDMDVDDTAARCISEGASHSELADGDTPNGEPPRVEPDRMGIDPAFTVAATGRKLMLTTPKLMSEERPRLVAALGAEVAHPG